MIQSLIKSSKKFKISATGKYVKFDNGTVKITLPAKKVKKS